MSIQTTTPEVVREGEASLAGMFFDLNGPVRKSLISIIPGRLTIGDPTRGDSQLSSSWTLSDAKGGLLVERANPARDIDRGYFSTCETRYQNQISLAPAVDDRGLPTGVTSAPTVLFEHGDHAYGVFGTGVWKWDEASGTWGAAAVATLPSGATDFAYFAGTLWVACGDAAAVQKFNGTSSLVAVNDGTDDFIATHLCVLDTKIYGMLSTGAMNSATDTGTIVIAAEGALDRDIDPSWIQGLHLYKDINGSPILYAATKVGLWFYDANNELWHASQLTTPRQDSGGRGATAWRGDFFYNAGVDVLKYNLGTISSVGLNKDDGLPSDQDGEIIAMLGGLNFLYVFLKGRGQAAESDPLFGGAGAGETTIMPATEAFSSLWATDGNGIWHRLWGSDTSAGDVPCAAIIVADGQQRLWWSADGTVYSMDVPTGIHNPLRNPTARFQPAGYHITPWFDADWTEEKKIAVQLRVGFRGVTAAERVRVRVGLDDDEGFAVDLGYLDAAGGPTGVAAFLFNGGLGVAFYRIRFRFELERGDADAKTPFVRFFTLNYLKAIDAVYGYDLTINLMRDYKNQSPAQMRARLEACAEAESLVPLRYKDAAGNHLARIVRVNAYRFIEESGYDDRGTAQLALGEVYPQG